MKNPATTLTMFLFVFNVVMAQDKKAHNTDDTGIALLGYSPVSYLDLGLAQYGDKNYMSVYEVLKYYFTSQEQKDTFDANPENYMPQHGGFCAMAMYHNKKVWVNPTKFVTKDGEYFLFLYDHLGDGKQGWLAGDHYERKAKAEANWKIKKLE